MLPVAVVCRPGSGLGERLLRRLPSEGVLLEDDAPLHVDAGGVRWGAVPFASLGALLIEAPLYPWPQPLAEPTPGESTEAFKARALAGREARALAISALRLAARSLPTHNDALRAAELCASTPLALERLEAAGVATLPWRVRRAVGNAPETGWERVPILASVGVPGGPLSARAGVPALEVRWDAPGCEVLVVADTVAAEGEGARESTPAERSIAVRAVRALGLDFAALRVLGGAIGGVDAAPDLDRWDRHNQGRVVEALAALLTHAGQPRRTA